MSGIRHYITAALQKGEGWIFANPAIVLAIIFAVTLGFATQLHKLQFFTDFDDLLPQGNPIIQTYNSVRDNFGGANQVQLVIEVENGDIFNNKTLALINQATDGLDGLPDIDHNQVSSLTHRTVRRVYVTADGNFASSRFYDPQHPDDTPEQLKQLRKDVRGDAQVYGVLVSPDMKAAMIKGRLTNGKIDYEKNFAALQKLRAEISQPGYHVYATGNPVLIGWVYTYFGQIVGILFTTLALLALLLLLYFRRFYGVALPLLGIALSTVWGVGFTAMMGYNMDPLSMPIPFLIAARAMSHGVQLVARYYEEFETTHDGRRAARNALDALFRPGSLAIIVDAACIGVIMLGLMPFDFKLGLSVGFWALSVIFTVHFMIPLALTLLPQPRHTENKNEGVRKSLARVMAATGGHRSGAVVILALSALVVVAALPFSASTNIGDSEAGSPILKPDSDYNRSTAAINALFPGTEELHVLARTKDKDGLNQPEVMQAIETFASQMRNDPDVGGSVAIPMVVRGVNQLIHYNDPRWAQIPDSSQVVGGLLLTYMASSPIPGALRQYINSDGNEADVVLFFKDHRAPTIERAMEVLKTAAAEASAGIEGLSFQVSGGVVGLNAAINEALHRDHMILVPLVMFIAFVLVALYYQSLHAGLLMIIPMLFSTILSYAFMDWHGISINVNTTPVVMVGVGVGIDYAVYFMDRIREEMARVHDVGRAAINAFSTTGYAVSFIAVTLIAGVVMWIFMSDLRFQSDAALLLSVMLFVNAIAAMLIVPAWCVVFKPRFVLDNAGTVSTERLTEAVSAV
ncbi:MAG: transporter [Nevskiaceae bacterium]|nr:MAG: transporter [Nevskiaceae bacterium]TBR72653.1 MAG: transporter [Nevskiaceae bacterium]